MVCVQLCRGIFEMLTFMDTESAPDLWLLTWAGLFDSPVPSTSTSNLSQIGTMGPPSLRCEPSASQIAAQTAVKRHLSQQPIQQPPDSKGKKNPKHNTHHPQHIRAGTHRPKRRRRRAPGASSPPQHQQRRPRRQGPQQQQQRHRQEPERKFGPRPRRAYAP